MINIITTFSPRSLLLDLEYISFDVFEDLEFNVPPAAGIPLVLVLNSRINIITHS
jgi:hypothetical protein